MQKITIKYHFTNKNTKTIPLFLEKKTKTKPVYQCKHIILSIWFCLIHLVENHVIVVFKLERLASLKHLSDEVSGIWIPGHSDFHLWHKNNRAIIVWSLTAVYDMDLKLPSSVFALQASDLNVQSTDPFPPPPKKLGRHPMTVEGCG